MYFFFIYLFCLVSASSTLEPIKGARRRMALGLEYWWEKVDQQEIRFSLPRVRVGISLGQKIHLLWL